MLMTGRLVARETGRDRPRPGGDGPGGDDVADGDARRSGTRPASRSGPGSASWRPCGTPSLTGGRAGGWRWSSSGLSAALAGGFWTIGHLAGPVAAVYLWVDGRRRCRLARRYPWRRRLLAVALSLALAARPIDSRVSFHGRTIREAIDPIQGVVHTAQAIPENLVFGNLGLEVANHPDSRPRAHARTGRCSGRAGDGAGARTARPSRPSSRGPPQASWPSFTFNPLECAVPPWCSGATWSSGPSAATWISTYLRTINLRPSSPGTTRSPDRRRALRGGVVVRPSPRGSGPPLPRPTPASLTWRGALGLGVWRRLDRSQPPESQLPGPEEHPGPTPLGTRVFPDRSAPNDRANASLLNQAEWQRPTYAGSTWGEQVARRLGLGRWSPRRLRPPLDPRRHRQAAFPQPVRASMMSRDSSIYPETGRALDPAAVRGALAPFFNQEKEPRPP